MFIKDPFKMFMKILNSDGTKLVKGSADFHSIIGVRIAFILRCDEKATILSAQFAQFVSVVVTITQNETNFMRQLAKQTGNSFTISYIGRSAFGSQRKPDGCYRRNQMQFLAVNPAMPARFGPMGFLIKRRMGNKASCS